MSQQSGFFNAKVLEDGSYDRVYLAEDFANYFASFVGNGVFAKKLNGLQVLADSGMTLKVRSGQAWINGYWYENDSDLSLSLSTAPATGYRIDSVVLRYQDTSRSISCFVKTGDLNVNDPAPIREGGIYELVLAYVKVSAGNISISQSNIVDKRGDNSVCGFVTGVIDQIDTTEFHTQLNNWLEEYMNKTENQYDSFSSYLSQKKNTADSDLSVFEGDLNTLKTSATNNVNALIEEIRGLLDGDVATNLQNQIDGLNQEIEVEKDKISNLEADSESVWNKISGLENHSIAYSYAMALMALEGTPKMSLSDSTKFTIKGTRADGLKVFADYGFEILIFRNIEYVNELLESNFSSRTYDVAVITDTEVKESLDMPQMSVPSLFGRMKLKWSSFQANDTKTVTVNISVNQSYADPPDPSEYTVVIREYSKKSPYTDKKQNGNWFKQVQR